MIRRDDSLKVFLHLALPCITSQIANSVAYTQDEKIQNAEVQAKSHVREYGKHLHDVAATIRTNNFIFRFRWKNTGYIDIWQVERMHVLTVKYLERDSHTLYRNQRSAKGHPQYILDELGTWYH